MFAGLIDLIWPRVCPICDTEITGPGLVHRRCLRSLADATERGRGRVPVHARWQDGPGWFALLHAWKYAGQRGLARIVAREMARRLQFGSGPVALVPMPDDPARRLARGYSPVLDLTRELAGRSGAVVHTTLLRRPVAAGSQTACADDEGRRANVRDVFRTGDLARCHPGALLVLVDDQVTSGASVAAASRLLGARGHRIVVWCAARAARAPRGLA